MRALFYFFFFALLFTQCKPQEKCGEIYDKVSQNGRYFFILDANYSFDVSTQNDPTGSLPDNRLSGEVNRRTYNQFSIGDEYCQ